MDDINEEHAGPRAQAVKLDVDIIGLYLYPEATMMPKVALYSALPPKMLFSPKLSLLCSNIVSRHSYHVRVHSGLVSSSSPVAIVIRHSLQSSMVQSGFGLSSG